VGLLPASKIKIWFLEILKSINATFFLDRVEYLKETITKIAHRAGW
jgi:hypothetical protein